MPKLRNPTSSSKTKTKAVVVLMARRVAPLIEEQMGLAVPDRFRKLTGYVLGDPWECMAEVLKSRINTYSNQRAVRRLLQLMKKHLSGENLTKSELSEWDLCWQAALGEKETKLMFQIQRGQVSFYFEHPMNRIFINLIHFQAIRRVRPNSGLDPDAGVPFRPDGTVDKDHPNYKFLKTLVHEIVHAVHLSHFPEHSSSRMKRRMNEDAWSAYCEGVAEFYEGKVLGILEGELHDRIHYKLGHDFFLAIEPHVDNPLIATAHRLPTYAEIQNPDLYLRNVLGSSASLVAVA